MVDRDLAREAISEHILAAARLTGLPTTASWRCHPEFATLCRELGITPNEAIKYLTTEEVAT